jgi:type II secretory pathway pseudopilin PulG
MKTSNERGLTLVELLLAIAGMTIISAAGTFFLTTSLDIQAQGSSRSEFYREGLFAMEKMKEGVKRCTFLMIPNAHSPVRDILAFSGLVNDDNDFYFGDTLFPRIDEDPKRQMTDDDQSGIAGVDDDGDTLTDEGDKNDDDEDGLTDEDQLDGIDNDGDGNVDEDTGEDANIAGMDDDADGSVDEGDAKDDDEDGVVNEDPLNPIIYFYDSGTNTLTESIPSTGESTDLSTNVTLFQVTYEAPDATHGPRVQISLTLTGDDGESITFSEYVYVENTLQRIGQRVR